MVAQAGPVHSESTLLATPLPVVGREGTLQSSVLSLTLSPSPYFLNSESSLKGNISFILIFSIEKTRSSLRNALGFWLSCLWRIVIFRHSLTFRDLDTMRVCAIWLCFFSI